MKKILSFSLMAIAGISFAFAQVKSPAPSPKQKVSQELGLNKIIVKYSRPSVKERTIFGDLVPFGQMWRTGANAPTVIEFKGPVIINGAEIKGGEYALFAIPGEDMWTIVLNSNTKKNAWEYDETSEVARFEAEVEHMGVFTESFTIGFDNLRDDYCNMYFMWEKTKVSFKIQVNTDKEVMASIDKAMSGPSASDYYLAARYYFENKKDNAKALEWITKADQLSPDRYWVLKWKSEIEAANGKYKEAIASAQKSAELAAKNENKEYVKINNANIELWSKQPGTPSKGKKK